MTVQEATDSKPSFEVWARLGETFAVIGRRPLVFFGFSFLIAVILPLAIGFVIVYAYQLFVTDLVGQMNALSTVLSIASLVITILIQLFLYGVLTQSAHDACTGARRRVGTYVGTAFRRMIPLFLVLIPVGIIVSIGYVVIGILGLWATAVYAALLPIVVVEGLGFRAMGRARALSKEYRWPIVGYILIIGLMLVVLVVAIGLAVAGLGDSMVLRIAPFLLLLVPAVSAVVTSVASVVVYNRLRTIKEGNAVAELADVFA